MRHYILAIAIQCVMVAGYTATYAGDAFEDSLGWNLRKDKHGIKVYTRDHKKEGLLEYKAITTLEADMEDLVGIIYDVENYPMWTENCESAMIFKVLSDTSWIEYMTTAVPWPLDDRDVVLEFAVIEKTDDYFEVSLISIPQAVPEKENYVRIEVSEGNWIFKKEDDHSVRVIHQFLSDPGGGIPMWIVNLFIVSGPYKTLLNLKERCKILNE